MKIIDKSSKIAIRDLSKLTKKLLDSVPEKHLIGLESIILMDRFIEKGHQDAYGRYKSRYGLEKASIEIAVFNVYGNKPAMFCLIPVIGKLMLALVLFHEVGHHYCSMTHGISKKERERFAEKYKGQALRTEFKYWCMALKPFKPIIDRYLKKKLT